MEKHFFLLSYRWYGKAGNTKQPPLPARQPLYGEIVLSPMMDYMTSTTLLSSLSSSGNGHLVIKAPGLAFPCSRNEGDGMTLLAKAKAWT